ncbi:MAG TPA: efflux RND transporter periplasmic adaptor subunit [Longimicrobiales bacterium]
MRRRTRWIIGGGVLLLATAGMYSLQRGGRAGPEVRIETVTRRDLEAIVTGSGWIRPHRSVDVQADIMGRIIELHVAEGDVVRRGQVLLRIDPTQYEAAVARARAGVSEALAREAQARANLLQAERMLARARALAAQDSDFVSRQALEEAETEVRIQTELAQAATYSVAQARAALGEAEDRLAKTVIRAPIDGVVTRLAVEEGETAIVGTMNNPGSLLLTISDLSLMEAVIRVDETDIPEIELGDSARISIDAFPRRTFTGRVVEIGHSAVRPPGSLAGAAGQSQGQAVDFEVVLRLENPPPGLRPDLSATADIVTATRDSVLAIPIIALTVREREAGEVLPQEQREARAAAAALDNSGMDQEGVFVVRGGKAEFVPVEVGIVGRDYFEIVSGIAEGDSIIAGPYEAIRTLRTGQPVRAMQESRQAPRVSQEAGQ